MWEKELSIARQAALESGKILKDLFGKVNHITKKGEIDLVTEADIQSEKAIVQVIHHTFPQDSILTEEAGEAGEAGNLPDRQWIIDPLDGTTNFVHAFPFFCVSIALQVEGKLVLGLVFNPYLDEHFESVKGKGALLNGRVIGVSRTRSLRESLLATGFPYSVYKDPQRIVKLLGKMLVHVQGVRRPGSAAIDLCYVAAGRLDGFWEEGLKPWDTAAGSLIVSEAGGIVSDYKGVPYSPFQKSIVAANPFIYKAMLKELNG